MLKRIVKQSKYERKDRTAAEYWKGVCTNLEAQSAIPRDERSEVVAGLIPPNLYKRVAVILKLDPQCKPPESFVPDTAWAQSDISKKSLLETCDIEPVVKKKKSGFSRLGMLDDDEDDDDSDLDELIRPTSPRKPLKPPPEPISPYYTFTQKKGKRAVSWDSRYMPINQIEEWEKTLHQRAKEKTRAIVTDFCKWLRGLGGHESSLNEESLGQLFEIGHLDDAAQALMVRLKELPTVPQEMAEKANMPERSIRATLRRQIKRDFDAGNREPRYFAFGTALPLHMRVHKSVNNAKEWMECKNIPPGLASMKAVWEGITAIRSTRAFCTWLHSHPEIDPPQYLLECGLMDEDFGVSRGQPRVSFDPRFEDDEEEVELEDKNAEGKPAAEKEADEGGDDNEEADDKPGEADTPADV